jgi:hypothetical protein
MITQLQSLLAPAEVDSASYHSRDELACSTLLKAGIYTEDESRWHPHEMLTPTEVTEAMDLGTITHAMYYEPDSAPKYVARPMKNGRAVASNTAECAAFVLDNPGCIVLHPDKIDKAKSMVASVQRSHEAGAMAKYLRTTSIVSTEQGYVSYLCGHFVRFKPDRIRVRNGDGLVIIEDLKTSAEIYPHEWRWHAQKLGYFRRAAFYIDALRAIIGDEYEIAYRFVVVQSSAPHLVAVYQASEQRVADGRSENEAALNALAHGDSEPIWLREVYEI